MFGQGGITRHGAMCDGARISYYSPQTRHSNSFLLISIKRKGSRKTLEEQSLQKLTRLEC
jgi:hypothetical protein